MGISFNSSSRDYKAVVRIAELIKEKGGRVFLVGGCVRDAIMGNYGKDFDVEIYGISLEDIFATLSPHYKLSKVGMSFGVIKVHGYNIDIALPRTESKTGAGHRGFIVETNPNLNYADAASRRDFTINAIMYDPLADELVDPWHGMEDIKNHILRHTSSHFSEDPLRVLRAMQFAGRLEFKVAEETVELCHGLSQNELASERIAAEWEKLLLKSEHPTIGLDFLIRCGWIDFYPELKSMIGCRQSPQWHPEGDVWTHTMLSLDAAVKYRTGNEYDDLCLMLAVLLHDVGKPLTTTVDSSGKISSIGHPEAGAPIAYKWVQSIWNRNDLAEQVSLLVRYHMDPFFMVKGNARDAAYRRLAIAVKRMDLLHIVGCCDMLGITRPDITLMYMDAFQARINELAVKDSVPKPIILGRHLMEFGIKPGPEMGAILKKCFERQLDGDFSSLEEGLEIVRKMLIAKEG